MAVAESTLPRLPQLRSAVAFWRAIFGQYSANQVVLHDDRYLGKVYGVLDFRGVVPPDGRVDAAAERIMDNEVAAGKERIRGWLIALDEQGGRPATREERLIVELFSDVHGEGKYREAAERVRSQSGLRESFAAGLSRMTGYHPEMQRIFHEEGVPIEVTRLTMVESCFNMDAYSKVGAGGVWQFMPGTGREFMAVNSAVDERRDPIRATRAAAQLLRANYESLGEWPLAITAYNHGRGGMHRAVRETGTSDLGVIVEQYRGPAFGFASRNFYAEFLAAYEVSKNAEHYFGAIPHTPAPRSREVRLYRPVTLREAAMESGATREALIAMNPAFLTNVIRGQDRIPAGYTLRVPVSSADVHLALRNSPKLAERAATPEIVQVRREPVQTARFTPARNNTPSRSPARASKAVVHRVERGQTLTGIARKYGTTVGAIRNLNSMGGRGSIKVGQKIRIPKS